MLRSLRRQGRPAIIVVAAVVLGACSAQPSVRVSDHNEPRHAAAVAANSARPYQLYTHCGIDEARIGTRYFEAMHPLSDGNGNPPAGWGNPYQDGTITLLSSSRALFRDSAGHQVLFQLRPGARSFKHVCA